MPEASPHRGLMIVLAYLWLLALVPLLVERHDADIQWHAKHGIVLTIAELILFLAYVLVMGLVSFATLGFGCILGLVLVFIWVGILALHVAAIVRGMNGGRLIVPRVSEYANRL